MSRDTLIAVIASVAIHLLLLGVLLFNFSRTPKVVSMPEQPEIIQAQVLGDFETPAERLRKEQKQRLLDEEQRQIEEAQRLLQQEQALRQAEADKQRKAEEARKQADAEKQRKAEEERKQAEAEKQRKAEEERKKVEAEKQRKAEDERKKAEAEKQRKAAEEQLKQQMAAEAKRLQDEQNQELRKKQIGEWESEYITSIKSKIQRNWNWLRPLDSPSDFSCVVYVVQSQTGDVQDVKITKSCGSPLLDRSVENAVRKSSPLPPPPDKSVFDREIQFVFVPRS